MKKCTALALCLLFFFLAGFTWEGTDVDPNTFSSWRFISVSPINPQNIIKVVAQNPDKTAEIQRIIMSLYLANPTKFYMSGGRLIDYAYFKKGEIYMYILNAEGNYERNPMSPEEQQKCFQCHKDKQTHMRL